MRKEAVKEFLVALGVDESDIQVSRRGWVQCRCPLAPYTHSGGVDSHPSFGIYADEDKESVYCCFGCSPDPHKLGRLLHNLFVVSGSYPFEAARVLLRHESGGESGVVEIKDIWKGGVRDEKEIRPLPARALKRFPLLARATGFEARRCREFLEERGIDRWTQAACRLRYSEYESAVVFPLVDRDGAIFCLRKRSRKKKYFRTVTAEEMKLSEDSVPTTGTVGVWFGMHLVDWRRRVILVEGEIDCMRLMSLGLDNVIASATSSVSTAQINALTARIVWMGYDADKAGKLAHKRISEMLGGKTILYELDWSVAKKKDGSPCKDPGDLPDREALNLVLSSVKRLDKTI